MGRLTNYTEQKSLYSYYKYYKEAEQGRRKGHTSVKKNGRSKRNATLLRSQRPYDARLRTRVPYLSAVFTATATKQEVLISQHEAFKSYS
jgi:hypothetical protein